MATVVRQVTISTTAAPVVLIPPGWTAQIYWLSGTGAAKNAFIGIGSKVTTGNGWAVNSANWAQFGAGRHDPPQQVYGVADAGTATICIALCHM